MVGGRAMQWNPYLYVGANPVNWIDPSGEFFWLPVVIPLAIAGLTIAGAALYGAFNEAYNQAKDGSWDCGDIVDAAWQDVKKVLPFAAATATFALAPLIPMIAPVVAFTAVGGLSGQVFRAVDNIVNGRPVLQGLGKPRDIIEDMLLTAIAYGVGSATARAITWATGPNSWFGRLPWVRNFRAWDEGGMNRIRDAIGRLFPWGRSAPTPGISQSQLQDINRGYPGTGRIANCRQCAIATDSTIAGQPASAMPGSGGPLTAIENQYGRQFSPVNSSSPNTAQAAIEAELLQAGSGARGIIAGYTQPPYGHVWNAYNYNGRVIFLDGQVGRVNTFYNFTHYEFLMTSP